ncbi:hypothetical protein MTR67_048449 [Solanum verrucosum]|uniref:Reverse transcriptase Ty1/copia-type domain-containing protein n=1 Tax=Solanum verrucosum TaxID=315347 RepID=A0AAF0V0U6_SOLVR|nr:hypothetical protein MTR67_048449 [Solanum verrucosum]
MKVFEMTDLGLMAYFLGVEIKQNEDNVFICQKKYAQEILKKFHMEDSKVMSTPMNQKENFSKDDGTEKVDEAYYRSLIGCLMYLTATRPDILYAVSFLSRFMHCASDLHLRAAKRIVRYIKGIINYGVKFHKSQKFRLNGFSDSDWGGAPDMKSTSGFCFNLGSGAFSWYSKKQDIVAQSTAEAEFIAATAAVNQALWLRKIMCDLNMKQKEGTEVFIDNQAAISIANNPVFHAKTKHFNIKLFFLRDVQKHGDVKLLYCKSDEQGFHINFSGFHHSVLMADICLRLWTVERIFVCSTALCVSSFLHRKQRKDACHRKFRTVADKMIYNQFPCGLCCRTYLPLYSSLKM